MMRLGIAADHGGFELKRMLAAKLASAGHEIEDFGAYQLTAGDDYPDFVIPMARAIASGKIKRGIAICGSGVGACVVANKVPGIRAALIADYFTAHRRVEDDDMNIICLGGRVIGSALAWDLVQAFLGARFKGGERYLRRLRKVAHMDKNNSGLQ